MSHRLALTAAWRSRLVPMRRSIAIRACCSPTPSKKKCQMDLLFHLISYSRPDQCLRPSSEQNGLGFAKVGPSSSEAWRVEKAYQPLDPLCGGPHYWIEYEETTR